jgi:A/G-specific adenine glycosylase
MLQQTQVATVIPYYHRFLDRFPDVYALADAPEERVLAAWSGLGYYRRARALHSAARTVVERHAGRVPDDPDELQALPGVGRYTAGAIASVAYGRPEAVVDGNVRRVLSRVLASTGEDEPALWAAAQRLVPGSSPGDLNQALMELGALVCTPRAPRCAECPVRSECGALASGDPEAFPRPRPTRPTESVRVAVALIRRNGRVLLERPGNRSPLRGTWDLPATEVPEGVAAPSRLEREMQRRHGLILRAGPATVTARHGILHRRLTLEMFTCRAIRGRTSNREDLRWIHGDDLAEAAVSGATHKLLPALSERQRIEGKG